MNIVIIGLGYSARAFVAAHSGAFARITGTVRHRDKAERLAKDGFDMLVFDGVSASQDLMRRVRNADALLVSAPPDTADPTLSCLGASLRDAPNLGWIGYLSTVGVYGDHGGAWVDERTPCLPISARSRLRFAVEEQWLKFGHDAKLPVQIFRLSGIYGPQRNAFVKLREGTARRLIKPGQVFNRIHVADIAGALAASLARPQAGVIYNLTDDEPAPPQDVIAYAASLANLAPPPEIAFDPQTLTPMAASFYGENKRVSNALIKAELGYRFKFPSYREGLRALHGDDHAA